MTYETLVSLDQHDRDTIHVYVRTTDHRTPVKTTYLTHEHAMKVESLHVVWGRGGAQLEAEIKAGLRDFTELTPVRLTMSEAEQRDHNRIVSRLGKEVA
jgi:hypothetical protein